ncbi:ABC transporter ATP-binding protein [Saccharothrix obliqua]|uniref:ABC transporter ATP-binding protein n=1 Tax=Saccharothrix obliqua TaxID=2861747 RepID=UPI001C5E8B7E|nr:ABC transporter ATP-binding protein [Saccharothrix obliqua]MBW4721716.1 ABC transporter ATP-binding protein/permease [Saccharothrix obliqua]
MGPYFRALAGRRRAVLALLGWSVLEGVPALLSGRLVGLAVDRGFAVGDVRTGVAWLVAFAVVAVLGGFGLRQVFTRLGDVVEPLRDALVTTVVRGVLHDGRAHRRRPDASAVARITRHVEVVRDATAGLLVQARALLVTTTAALVGLATTVSSVAWLVVLPVVAALLLFGALLPSLARGQRALVLADEGAAEAAGAVLLGVRDVVACDARDHAAADVRRQVDRQARAAVRVAWASALRGAVIGVGGFLPLALLLVLAPGMVARGALSAGDVLAAVVYLGTSVQPALRRLADTTSTVVLRLAVALRRLAEVAPDVPPAGDLVPDGGGVELRGVTFGWGEHAEPVVRDLDLALPPGTHLAVVGPSGIGKSTLASLVTGLVEPRAGVVLLGGAPVRLVRPAERSRRIALVPQETYLFTGTVRENLALFAPDASDDELLAAVAAVGAADVVDRLGGLAGEVGHAGGGLSAGEAQLLAAARVYACPADVVVLDEATSNLDPAAEAVVERAFAARGGVLVVIAHRLSSALRADRVLVMDGGAPLLGSHDELMAGSAAYAELMAAWQPVSAG